NVNFTPKNKVKQPFKLYLYVNANKVFPSVPSRTGCVSRSTRMPTMVNSKINHFFIKKMQQTPRLTEFQQKTDQINSKTNIHTD
ncbi:MAG: hypothetical protein ACRCVX_02080, partial [Shewanella sp.]